MKLSIFENESGKPFNADERHNLFLKCTGEYISASTGQRQKGRQKGTVHLSSVDCFVANAPRNDGGCSFVLATGAHGKPYFAKPPLQGNVHFSISHSGRYWAALFADSEIGVDIEDLSIRKRLSEERMKKIAERFFAKDEYAYVVDSPTADMATRFFRIWTAKESYIKYTGNGLSEGLSSFSVFDPPGGITIRTLSHAPNIICSYCHEGTVEAEIFFKGNKIEWTG